MKSPLFSVFFLFVVLFTSCSKEMYFNKTAAQVSKSTFQVQEKVTSGSGYLYKTENNEIIFMQNTTGIKSNFDKAVVVAFENDVNISVEPGDINYVDVIYFKDKRSLMLHSKKENTIYLLGLDEKQSLDKIALLKENPSFKTQNFKTILGYGISVLSGNWSLDKFLTTGNVSAFDGLDASSNLTRDLAKNSNNFMPPECTSGGEGSNSCSTGSWPEVSCSVSCNSGYYACCKSSNTTCTCKKVTAQ